MCNYKVDFYIKSLPKKEILDYLKKNESAYYIKWSNIVDLDIYAKKLSFV